MATQSPLFAILAREPLTGGGEDVISSIPLDVRESSTYTFTASPTENPIESGAVVTDHVVKGPMRIDLRGIVSETPIGVVPTSNNSDEADDTVAPGARCVKAYQALHAAYNRSTLLDVVTELAVFKDMVITSLVIERTADRGGNALFFALSMVSLVIVESLTATLPSDVVASIKRRRAKSARALTDRQKELNSRRSKELAGGKVSTEPATTSQTTSAWSSASDQQRAFTSGRL